MSEINWHEPKNHFLTLKNLFFYVQKNWIIILNVTFDRQRKLIKKSYSHKISQKCSSTIKCYHSVIINVIISKFHRNADILWHVSRKYETLFTSGMDSWFLPWKRNTDTSLHEKIVANVGQFASAFVHFDLHAVLKKFPCLWISGALISLINPSWYNFYINKFSIERWQK